LAREQQDTARVHAERALAIRESADVPPSELAEARFVLARVLWHDASARPRARELAELARAALAKTGDRAEPELAELDAWLAEHRLP
jgi:hypothetical protein